MKFMNKKTLTILGIILLVVIAGSFWFVKNSNEQETKSDIISVKTETQDNQNEVEIAEENQESIQPKFGIDDSQLKYNPDGSVDTSEWKTFEHLNEKYLLPPGWSIVGTNGLNGSMSIINLTNFEELKNKLTVEEILKLKGVVEIGTASAPVDFGGSIEIDERIDRLFKENVDALLKEAAEMSVQYPLYARCIKNMTSSGESCKMDTTQNCSYSSVKSRGEQKYIVVKCYYDKSETDKDKYIYDKILINKNKFYDSIVEHSVSLETNNEELIEDNKKIYSIMFDKIFRINLN